MNRFILVLFLLLLTTVSCKKDFDFDYFVNNYESCQYYITVEGKHDFYPVEPIIIRKGVEHMIYKFRYDSTFTYFYENLEWRDWLKGGGLSFNLTSNYQEAIMWVFRYNYLTDKIEHTAYLRINGNLIKGYLPESEYDDIMLINNPSKFWWGQDNVMMELNHGETGFCEIKVDYNNKIYSLSFYSEKDLDDRIAYQYPFSHDNIAARDIGLFFGGTIVPYKQMTMLKCQKRIK